LDSAITPDHGIAAFDLEGGDLECVSESASLEIVAGSLMDRVRGRGDGSAFSAQNEFGAGRKPAQAFPKGEPVSLPGRESLDHQVERALGGKAFDLRLGGGWEHPITLALPVS
jgi:hypothetical protein